MLLIVSALKSEIAPLLAQFPQNKKSGLASASLYDAGDIHFLRLGIGAAAVHKNFKVYLDRYKPTQVLNVGLAGSLSKNIQVAEIFNISEVWHNSAENSLRLIKFKENNFNSASLFTADQVVNDPETRDALYDRYQIVLVDMETWHLASWATRYKIPFSSIKIVSDHADQFTVHDFKQQYQQLAHKLAQNILPLIRN